MTDQYADWKRMLRGDGPASLHLDKPCPGFYRLKRGGKWVPVAIWRDERDALCCVVDGKDADADAALRVWPWCYPIKHEVFVAVTERGEGWPDIDETVAAQIDARRGHNQPPPESEIDALREQIDAAEAAAKSYAEIGDDETASRAQSLRSRALELSRAADKIRESEKRPHFEASKAVDAKWQPLVRTAAGVADAIRRALGAWETKKLQSQRERERLAAEAAARMKTAVKVPEFAPPPPAPPSAAPSPVVRGGYGRAASVKAVHVVTAITDRQAAMAFFAEHEEMTELLMKLAQRAIDAGRTVPGVTVEERAKVA